MKPNGNPWIGDRLLGRLGFRSRKGLVVSVGLFLGGLGGVFFFGALPCAFVEVAGGYPPNRARFGGCLSTVQNKPPSFGGSSSLIASGTAKGMGA